MLRRLLFIGLECSRLNDLELEIKAEHGAALRRLSAGPATLTLHLLRAELLELFVSRRSDGSAPTWEIIAPDCWEGILQDQGAWLPELPEGGYYEVGTTQTGRKRLSDFSA